MPSSFSSSSPPLPSLTSSFLTCFSTDTQQCCFQCQPPSGSYKIASRSCAAGAARSAAAAAAAGAGSRLRHSEAARAPACRCSLRPPSLMIARAHVQSRAHKHAKAHMHAHLLLCSRDCMQHGALASWSYCKSAKKLAGQSWMACDGRSTACSMLEHDGASHLPLLQSMAICACVSHSSCPPWPPYPPVPFSPPPRPPPPPLLLLLLPAGLPPPPSPPRSEKMSM